MNNSTPADLWKKINANKTPGTMPVSEKFWNKFKEGDFILEVGCGWGRIVYECLRRKLKVMGIDINHNETSMLKERLVKDGIDEGLAKIYEKSILDTGLEDNKFDGIIMQGVMAALARDDRLRCLREANRLLKVGGCIHIGEFELNEKDPEFKKRYDADYLITKEYGTLSVKDETGKEMYQSHNFSVTEISDLMIRSGFKNIQVIKDTFTSYHGHKKPGMMIIGEK